MADPPILETRGLSVVYQRGGTFDRRHSAVTAVAEADLAIEKGSITALVGPSGSGKSTLARCLALLEAPSRGDVLLDGRSTAGLDRRALGHCRRQIQLIFQDAGRSIASHFDVVSTVTEPLRVTGASAAACRQRAIELLEQVDLGSELLDRPAHRLSGGQLRRLILARALAARPRALVLDEALTSLDPSLVARLVGLLLDLQAHHGLTYILVSHDPRLVAHLADRIVRMENGRLIDTG